MVAIGGFAHNVFWNADVTTPLHCPLVVCEKPQADSCNKAVSLGTETAMVSAMGDVNSDADDIHASSLKK